MVSVQHVPVMTREATIFLCLQVGYPLLQEVWLQLAWEKNAPDPQSSPLVGSWAGHRDAVGSMKPGEKKEDRNWRHPDTKQSDLWERMIKKIGPKYSRLLDRF